MGIDPWDDASYVTAEVFPQRVEGNHISGR
jgi:hypothetical protein